MNMSLICTKRRKKLFFCHSLAWLNESQGKWRGGGERAGAIASTFLKCNVETTTF